MTGSSIGSQAIDGEHVAAYLSTTVACSPCRPSKGIYRYHEFIGPVLPSRFGGVLWEKATPP
jgi:hypothetical protein